MQPPAAVLVGVILGIYLCSLYACTHAVKSTTSLFVLLRDPFKSFIKVQAGSLMAWSVPSIPTDAVSLILTGMIKVQKQSLGATVRNLNILRCS